MTEAAGPDPSAGRPLLRALADPWSWQGAIGRGRFVLLGALLFAVKYGIDSAIAAGFGTAWSPLMYLSPRVSPLLQPGEAPTFWLALLAGALPFIAAGVALCARRLRDMGVSPFWCGLFFLPFLHWAFFAVLAATPSRAPRAAATGEGAEPSGPARTVADDGSRDRDFLDHLVALPAQRRFLLATGAGVLFGAAGLLLGTNVYLTELIGFGLLPREVLGVGLFVGVPFGVGFWPGYLFGLAPREGMRGAMVATLCASVVVFALLLALALEGLGCMVMAAPLVLPIALLGTGIGFACGRVPKLHGAALPALLLAPGLIGWEQLHPPSADEVAVVSTVHVKAAPEVVWRHVIAFPPIDSPPEVIFSIVALPIEARLDGVGEGALRRCVFTIGEFEEPIEVWDPGRELTFGVASQPAAVARYVDTSRGQFRLRANPDGTTTLVGTTWVRTKLHPAPYWGAWTRTLVHAIHMRVLEHVQRLSEGGAAPREGQPVELPSWLVLANDTCRCTRHVGAAAARGAVPTPE